ncbi:hypothetical protein [Dactylosporangium sp. CA-092794]|uniref:alpha-amylase family glycosyl hydrolase n=1 Tax=Dactylosporangium sp. CA-092794 TaxID=3239929 RepID=UPI003D93084C
MSKGLRSWRGEEEYHARARGLRRARAAIMLALALPGSMYLYQGEELGLPEVADIPADRRQDPAFFRTGGAEAGRDGSRVPLPWTSSGISLGFGEADPHLPQPAWFAAYSVQAEEADTRSTLSLYRRAVELRHRLQTAAPLQWLGEHDDFVAFTRGDRWISATNFGTRPLPLPEGTVLLASADLAESGVLPPETTVWLHRPDEHR